MITPEPAALPAGRGVAATAPPNDLRRFSFNQATARRWPLPELVAGCVAAGVGQVGLWREPVAAYGPARAGALCRSAGLGVTSLCRGGFFSHPDWWDENRRAVDQACAVDAGLLVLVAGGLPDGSRDLAGAREAAADSVARLAAFAAPAGVRLGIEPLHPMFCADRCVLSTFDQAYQLARRHTAGAVGVVVDTYHLWWDERVYAGIAAAGPHVALVQLADWVTPLPAGALTGRALPGAGCVEFGRFGAASRACGYPGPIEVEVFSEDWWRRPGGEVLDATVAAYREVGAATMF